MNKKFCLFILSSFLFSAVVFADQPNSSLDDKPTVDNAAISAVQVPAVPADSSAAATSTNYLYDLKKLIEKSRENIKEVNEKIKEQAVLKRNQKREERAREYYEKGMELTNEGKLDEARDYFEKAIRITEHPEMAGYIRESQRRLKKQENALQAQEAEHNHQIKQDENTRKEDVETAYKEAVDLYKQKKYHPAKDAFEHVDEIAPSYRATDSYLKIIDQDIITSDALAAKQQAIEIQRQQNEAESARSKEKQMWLEQIEEKEKERKESIDKQAEDVYDQAVELYKNKKFAEAKKKFEEVSWVIPDYKATMKYLGRIDRDAEQEQEHVAAEQQKALQEQRWEEEVERKKQEAMQQKELEAKERQHKKDVEEQAQFLYTAAVSLFDHKEMDEASEKFSDIEKLYPDFKSTRIYIARIGQWKIDQQKQQLEVQQKSQEESLRQKEVANEQQLAQMLRDKTAQAQSTYDHALDLYRDHRWAEAQTQFEAVDQIIPDFKSTSRYLQKLGDILAKISPQSVSTSSVPSATVASSAPVTMVAPPVLPSQAPAAVVTVQAPAESMPTQISMAVSLEDQQKHVQDIVSLAMRSEQLYHQIAEMSNDKSTVQMKRMMAAVEEILNNLREDEEHLLRQMRDEQSKRQEEQARTRQQELRDQAEKLYQDGIGFLHDHDYTKAKIKFLQLENTYPNYKRTRRYLSRIDVYERKANVQAMSKYEQSQADHLKQLQDKENAAELLRSQQDQQKEHDLEMQQQVALEQLVEKASAINEDIIQLARQHDYEGMKAKFGDLENIVSSFMTLKIAMMDQKDRLEHQKKMALEAIHQRNEMYNSQKQEARQVNGESIFQSIKEYRPVIPNQSNEAELYKRREIMQEQNVLYSEAIDRYEHKKFTQAKLLFGELADQHDRRADVWLKKVDRAITQQLLTSEVGEEKERTAFIEDQVRAQHELIIIQERERQRQKKLTEELERQKHLYEDDHLLQLRKEETMKSQERERQRQEEKRLRMQEESQKQQEMLRFHKIEIVAKPQPVVAPPAAPVQALPVAAPAVATAPSMTPKQLQAQIDFSNERKAFLDNKYKKDQQVKEHQAKIKAEDQAHQARIQAASDARQKRIEEREKEKKRAKELREQREKERQARIEADAQAREKIKEEKQKQKEKQQQLKAEQAQEQAQKIAQEEKRHEEFQRQQEEQREEKSKQDEILRQETQQREESERQERERQAQLEAQREAVRKQLEDGVEAMYQDAMRLYQQGEYTAAADRFKDVQEIIPGYKRSGQLMDQARMKSLETTPNASSSTTTPVQDPASPPVAHQDSVSKALDLFDSNVK